MDRSRDLGRITLIALRWRCAWFALAVAATSACGSSVAPGAAASDPNVVRAPSPQPAAATASTPSGIEYVFRADPELKRMSAALCLKGTAPPRLVYGSQPSAEFLREPRLVSEADKALSAPRALRVVGGQIELSGVGPDACLEYAIDLRAAAMNARSLVAYPTEHGIVTSTELFLWRPPRRAAGFTAHVRFELPAGMQASVPWAEDGHGAYALDETAFSFTGHALFGRFWSHDIAVPSGTIHVASPDGFSEAQKKAITMWIANAGNVVSLATGRFPVDRAQVIVLPTGGFRFGHTGRSGGASILFFMPDDIGIDSFRDDWIAIHEFSHLLHPFVQREDAWLSEGLATYMQEVLRVRAGMMKAEDAWRRLYEGAALGRDADGSLSSETQRMAFAGNYRTVYWAGAAIALMVDVELRRRSEGRESLDTALAGISKRPEFMAKPATAASLLAALDAAGGGTTCQQVAQHYVTGHELPNLTDLYRQLGLLPEAGTTADATAEKLIARKDAPLAHVRDAIMLLSADRTSMPFGR